MGLEGAGRGEGARERVSEKANARPKKKTRREAGFERYLRYRGDNWVLLSLGVQRQTVGVPGNDRQDAIDYFLALAAREA